PCGYFFFFNAPPSSAIYTLSLHDALPIYRTLSPCTGVRQFHEPFHRSLPESSQGGGCQKNPGIRQSFSCQTISCRINAYRSYRPCCFHRNHSDRPAAFRQPCRKGDRYTFCISRILDHSRGTCPRTGITLRSLSSILSVPVRAH